MKSGNIDKRRRKSKVEDISQRIDQLRQKAALGTLTLEESQEAIKYLRAIRCNATTKAKKKATSKKVINTDDLLGELDKL